jgi:hypothetical protein
LRCTCETEWKIGKPTFTSLNVASICYSFDKKINLLY